MRHDLKEELVMCEMPFSFANVYNSFHTSSYQFATIFLCSTGSQSCLRFMTQKSGNWMKHCRLLMSCVTDLDGASPKRTSIYFSNSQIKDSFGESDK